MPKHLIKRYTPNHDYVRNHKMLGLFGKLFLDPNLWHLNRRSVSGAIFVGVFWAFVPIPGQMFGAIFSAILLRVNVPIAFGLIFLTNPVTIPAIAPSLFIRLENIPMKIAGKSDAAARPKANATTCATQPGG